MSAASGLGIFAGGMLVLLASLAHSEMFVSDWVMWTIFTGLLLAGVIGVQTGVIYSNGRAEARARVAERLMKYHLLLVSRAYSYWLNATPTRLQRSPGGSDADSLEVLYLAPPRFDAMTKDDPDHALYGDAVSHLEGYRLGPDAAGEVSALLRGRTGTDARLSSLVAGLEAYPEAHNALVEGFSRWESEALLGMSKATTLELDFERRTDLSDESIGVLNLIRHVEASDGEDVRSLVLIATDGSQVSELRSLKTGAIQSSGKGLLVAASSDPERLKRLRRAISAFSKQRAKKMEEVTTSLATYEKAHRMVTSDLRRVVNAVQGGTLEGTCRTEKLLSRA